MQNSLLKVLKARVNDELSGLDNLHSVLRRRVDWLSEQKVTDPYLVEDVFAALAITLHDLYTGCERILLSLITNIDGGIPKSAELHRELNKPISRFPKSEVRLYRIKTHMNFYLICVAYGM